MRKRFWTVWLTGCAVIVLLALISLWSNWRQKPTATTQTSTESRQTVPQQHFISSVPAASNAGVNLAVVNPIPRVSDAMIGGRSNAPVTAGQPGANPDSV